MGTSAEARIEVLEETILNTEPETPSEVLSLLLITSARFDSFASNHTDHTKDDSVQQPWEELERAMDRLMRGMIGNGADSPLLPIYSMPFKWAKPDAEIDRLLKQLPALRAARDTAKKAGE